jgi:hypothetical protein
MSEKCQWATYQSGYSITLSARARHLEGDVNCFASKRKSNSLVWQPELDADCLFQRCDPIDHFLEAVVAE